MIKYIMATIAVLVMSTAALAENLIRPLPIAGTQFIKIYNDPNGGSLVSVDEDLDGVCDVGAIFYLRSRTEGGPLLSIPSRYIPCEDIDILVRAATKAWENAGYTPMIYDRDLGKLVPFTNPKLN